MGGRVWPVSVGVMTLGLSALAFGAPAPATPPATNVPVVARIQDENVTLLQLDSAGGSELFEAAQNLYEARVQTLYQLLSQQLIEREAQAHSISTTQLLNENLKPSAVGDTEIDALLKAHSQIDAKDPSVRQQAKGYLENQRRADAQRAYVTTLFKKYNVKIMLQAPPPPPPEEVRGAMAPIVGAANAPVTLIAFSDYRCPYCRQLAETVDRLLARYPKDLRVVYRHLPLHRGADRLAAAALCAAEQNRFTEIHHELFDVKADDDAALNALITRIGLNAETFNTCMSAEGTLARVAADRAEGNRLRISGTPTLFINGQRLRGAQPLEALSARVQEALTRVSSATAQVKP